MLGPRMRNLLSNNMKNLLRYENIQSCFEDIGTYAQMLTEEGWPVLGKLAEQEADACLNSGRKDKLVILNDEMKRIAALLFKVE